MRPKKLYIDPYNLPKEYPEGWFEVYVPREGVDVGPLMLTPSLIQDSVWVKRHTMVRFYVFGVGFVFSKRVEGVMNSVSAKKGMISVGIGKFVFNCFKLKVKK